MLSVSLKSARTAALLGGLALAAVAAVSVAEVRAQQAQPELVVKFDMSQLLRLPRPAAEIIIGNPAVADVSIQSGNLLVITGKSFGVTNIIALDAERNVIQDQIVMVRRDEANVVNVYKAANRSTYNCAPGQGKLASQCNPSIMPGDDDTFFNKTKSLAEAKIGFSEKAAESSGGGNGQ